MMKITSLIIMATLAFSSMSLHAEKLRMGTEGAYAPFNSVDKDGKLANTEILNNIEAPYYAYSMIGTGYSSPDAKEVLTEGPNSDFQIFDVATQTISYQSSFDNTASSNSKLIEADFDQDGRPDYFSILKQGAQSDPMITWFDPFQEKERWSFLDTNEEYYSRPEISRVINFGQESNQNLVSLFATQSGATGRINELNIYSFEADGVAQTFSKDIYGGQPWNSLTMGFQDIDNDGKPEIIMSKFERNCGNNLGSEIELIDDDFTYIDTIYVDECISVIPDILSKAPKTNIIASSQAEGPNLDGSSIAAYSTFIEIGAKTGDVIWESKRFIGQLDGESFVSFGDNPYLNKKMGVFDAGIYIFD